MKQNVEKYILQRSFGVTKKPCEKDRGETTKRIWQNSRNKLHTCVCVAALFGATEYLQH